MNNSLFYNHIEKNDVNRQVIEAVEEFVEMNKNQQVYLFKAHVYSVL